MNARNRLIALKVMLFFQFSIALGLPVVGGLLLVAIGYRPSVHTPVTFLGVLAPAASMAVVTYLLARLLERLSSAASRRAGASEERVQYGSLVSFATIGGLLVIPPNFVAATVGWRWSLPLYALYFLYLCQLHLRWKRYQQALTAAS